MATPKIVVLGAGYGGLMTVKGLQKQLGSNEAEIILINQNPYHYITTKLHEPAAGTSQPDDARLDIRRVIEEKRVRFIQDRVVSLDTHDKKIQLKNRTGPISYDYLIVALGSSPETFGIKGLLENAFFIRSISTARKIREHIEYNFALYAEEEKEELVTIVVGGAGFTGIEYVGELIDRIPQLCNDYDVPMEKVRIVNVEAAPTVMPGFDQDLIDYAVKYFESKGVEILTSTPIEECTTDGVILKGGEKIQAATVVWTGGVRGNTLVEESGIETMRGRVKVNEYLRAPGFDDVFVIGDCALVFNPETERPYPPTAQISSQQGQYLGRNLQYIIRGGEIEEQFQYKQAGTVASLGSTNAMGIVGKRKIYGRTASWMKRLIDLRWIYMLGGISLLFKRR